MYLQLILITLQEIKFFCNLRDSNGNWSCCSRIQ